MLAEQKHSTRGSRVIPQHSTNLAQTRLTSEIGRDRVLSGWYDRAMELWCCSSYIYQKLSCVQVCTNLVLATHACPEVPTMVARPARRTCVCTSVATTCLGEQGSPEFGEFLPRNSWCLCTGCGHRHLLQILKVFLNHGTQDFVCEQIMRAKRQHDRSTNSG